MPGQSGLKKKIPVVILGATGSVGQKFVQLLHNHPWFEIAALGASERSLGKPYKDAVNWLMPIPLPEHIGKMVIAPCEPDLPGRIAFSGLDSSVAGGIETAFAKAGFIVVSNSSNHRMDEDVPLVIPEVNANHLLLARRQKFSGGMIVTNPNCSVMGIALALKPLYDLFGIEAVHAVTMQSISGAGYPGVASLDILDNVIPHIRGEEEKVETEPLKILGSLKEDRIEFANFAVSAHCNRVPVSDGHMACVSVNLSKKPSLNEVIMAWNQFQGEPQKHKLPTAPAAPLYYFEHDAYPQPKLHRMLDKGMAVAIGRLRQCPIFGYKFALLSHNTIRGAAGTAVLIAELVTKEKAADLLA